MLRLDESMESSRTCPKHPRIAPKVSLNKPKRSYLALTFARVQGLFLFALSAALKGLYFSNSPQFWLNLQANYDIELAKPKVGSDIQPLAMAM